MRRLPPLIAFAALGVFWGVWGAVLPGVSSGLHVGDEKLGLALLCVAAGALPAMLIAGRLADRMGAALLAPAVAVFGLACALPGLVPDVVWLGIALLVVGAASGGLDVVMNAASTQIEAATKTRILHLAHAIFSASVLVSSVLSGFGREAGLSYAQLLLIAGASILIMAAVIRYQGTHASVPMLSESGHSESAVSLARIPVFAILLGGLCAVGYLVENGIQLWSAQHLERTLGGSPAIAGLGPGTLAASAIAGRLAGQVWAARLGDRMLLTLAGFVSAVGALIFALAPSWPVALIGLILAGASVSVTAPTLFARAGRIADPRRRGATVSAVATIGYLGFLVGPALLGAISGALGLRMAIVTIAVLGVCFALLSLFTLREREVRC